MWYNLTNMAIDFLKNLNIGGNKDSQVSAFQSFSDSFKPPSKTKILDVSKMEGYKDPSTVSSKPVLMSKYEPSSIPADSLQQPVADLNQVQTVVNDFSVPQVSAGFNASDRLTYTSPSTPTNTVAKEPSIRDQIQQGLLDSINKDNSKEIAKIREQEQVDEKARTANKVLNELRSIRANYEDKKDKLETENTAGRSMTAINNDINRLTKETNKNLAFKSIEYDIVNNDYQSAKATVDAHVQDLKDEQTRQQNLFSLLWNFTKDDMTESEKLQAQQAHDFALKEYDAEIEQTKNYYDTVASQQKGVSNAEAVMSGILDIDKIPSNELGATLQALNSNGYVNPAVTTALTTMQGNLKTIDDLLSGGTGLAVGSGITRTTGAVGQFFGIADRTAQAGTAIDNLIANIALDVLPALKGPASDKDIAFVKEASSKLNRSLDPQDFQVNLLDLRSKVVNGLVNSIVVPESQKIELLKTQFLIEDPEATSSQIREMVETRLNQLPAYMNTRAQNDSVSSINIPQSSRLAYVNNNVGNLRYAGQAGATQGEGGFAKFPTPEAGFYALINQIQLDQTRQLSLSKFVNKYAPPSENNTTEYVKYVSSALGVPSTIDISMINPIDLAKVIALKESSTKI